MLGSSISTKFSLFALSLSLLWCLGFMGLSLLSGWNQLSKHYGTTLKKTGLTYGFRTILLRYRLSYELSTRLTFTKEGLLVALIFLFRPGHMPLFIPWDDISVELKKEMLFTYTVLRFKEAPHIKMRLHKKFYAIIKNHM